jgi:S-adenosylmethionine hydrolase
MAEWPEREELARILDVVLPNDYAESDPLVGMLDRVLASAITRVKLDVGDWDEYEDVPDENLAQAALRMAELMALRPELASAVGMADPTYRRLMFGHRRAFGVA